MVAFQERRAGTDYTIYNTPYGFREFGVQDPDVFGDPPNFATAERDNATILLALADDRDRLTPHWKMVDKMWNAYVRLDDVDAIYAETRHRLGQPIDD